MVPQTVHLAVYDGLADWEVGHAIAHIRDPQWQHKPGRYTIATVGATLQPVATAGGVRIVPDLVLDQVDPADSAMLILPGAGSWHSIDGNGAFARAACQFLDAGVPIAAICGATFGLAREGLLDQRWHTSSAPEYLAATGYRGAARYRAELVVTDGNLITASPIAPVEFAREILAKLEVYQPPVLNDWYRLFGAQDALAYGSLTARFHDRQDTTQLRN
jgi:putative intracellular protease/amidase